MIGFISIYPIFANPFSAPVFGLPKLTLLKWFSLAAAGAWIISSIKNGSFELSKSNLRLPLLIFFALALFSSLQSVHPITSIMGQYGRWEGLSTLSCYIVVYLTAYNIAGNKRLIKPMFLAILVSSILVSVIAIVESFWTNPFLLFANIYCAAGFGQPNAYESSRSMASFGNAAFLAAYFTLTLPIIFSYLVVHKREFYLKGLSYISLSLATFALLLTFSRAAWLGATAGIILVIWLNWARIKEYRTQIVLVLIILAITSTCVDLFSQDYSIKSRVASMFKAEGSVLTRLQMWNSSLPLIPEKPLFGSGPDTFKYVFGKYKPEGWVEHISDPMVDKAHNDALQIAVTHGLLGLASYLWIFVLFLWMGVKRVRSFSNTRENWFAIGILGAVLAYFIHLQFNFGHFSTAPLFWLLLGLGSRSFLSTSSKRTFCIEPLKRQKYLALGVFTTLFSILAVLSTLPLAADISFSRGRDLQASGKLPEAMQEYQQAIKLNGYEAIYKLSLAEAFFKLGEKKHVNSYISIGANVFDEAMKANPIDEQVYFKAGAAYLSAGRSMNNADLLKESIKHHERGLVLNPLMVDAYIDIGVAHAYLKEHDKAIDAWLEALNIDPGNDRAYFDLGWAYEQKGERERAKKAYLKAYQLNPSTSEAKARHDRL